MYRRDFLALSGASLAAAPALARERVSTAWSADFERFILHGLARTHTPGMSVGLVRGGHTVFSAGYGYAGVETARHVTPDSIFQIGSVSKTVTATALMLLWQDGAFKLDDPVAPHLDFPVTNPKFPNVPITFRQLFTHTSGISDAIYDDLDFATGDLPPLRDFLAAYLAPGGRWYDAAKSYGDAKPGTRWSYSNVGAALLGRLGERLSGRPFDILTRERIFVPLGMISTSWRYEDVADNRLAQPYEFDNAHFKHLPRVRYPDWPAGLLCTSASDFALFLASYLQGGLTLLKPETIAAMFTPDAVPIPARKASLRQGLIWELAPFGGNTVAIHLGGDPGAATIATVNRVNGVAALAFANISAGHDMQSFQKDIIRRLLERGRAL